MSIETVGPERYEFQYHVTLEILLRFWEHKVAALIDSGGEDSTLNFELNGTNVELELQVKGAEHSTKAIDDTILCEYLAHFPSRSFKNCLFERLLTQPTKLVVFVCAQRAKDFASPLTVRSNWRGESHRTAPLSSGEAQLFLNGVVAFKPIKNTLLEQRRAGAFSLLGKTTSVPALNEAFKRLIVHENVTKEGIIARLFDHLRVLGVPKDRSEGTLLQMLQHVRDCKGTSKDVVPLLKDVLKNQIAPSIRPANYTVRGLEELWISELTTQSALLLSGPPRCGKTDAAKWVAGAFQELGFEVIRVGMVEEAERILLDTRRTEILVLLDDPLGSDLESSSKAGQALRSIDRLIQALGPNRRLLVAQSQEALLAAKAVESLEKGTTGGLPWHDLGNYPPGFLSQVWLAQSQRNQVSDEVRLTLASSIAAGELEVPPGVLAHLAAYHHQLQGPDVLRQALSLASESAMDFATTLRMSGAKDVIRALAVGSTAIETSANRELAFMLGAGTELDLPSLSGVVVDMLGEEPESPASAPSYSVEPTLSRDTKQSLVNLELHRVVHGTEADYFEFSHPFYRSAARAVLKQAVSIEKEDVLSIIRRGLFAPSAATSVATARNLWWLYRDLSSSLSIGKSLVKLAEKGLRWYFPTTRDLCYEFLLGIVKSEPENYSSKLESWVNLMRHIDIEDVIWDQGEPFFPTESEYSSLSFLRSEPAPDEAHVLKTIARMDDGDALPPPGLAVELLRFFKRKPTQLNSALLIRLLAFSQGLIRAEAAYTWLLIDRNDDDEILARLGRDTHPSVVGRMLDAVTEAWNVVSSDRRTKLKTLLRMASAQPETAAMIVTGLLNHFYSDDYKAWENDRSSEPWALVGEVLAPALRDFPNSFRMAGERLYDVCNNALEHLPSSSSATVVNAWIYWLQIRVAAGKLPDDYMLGLVTSLLDAPALSTEDRHKAIEVMLTLPSTGAVLVFVANLVARWQSLHESERLMVVARLQSESTDNLWIKAAALTQDFVPPEIQMLLLGAIDGFHAPAPQLIDQMHPALLTACVCMHRGSPQPLWYLGHHHDNSETWKDVIRHIARIPTHALFDDCLDEIFSFKQRFGADELIQIIRELDAPGRSRVFTLLLDWKTDVVGEWHQREFDLLLDLAPNDTTRAAMIDRMVENSEQIIERPEDVDRWSLRVDVREALEKAFPCDFAIPKMWRAIVNTGVHPSAELTATIADYFVTIIEHCPPKLISTHWTVERYLRALKADQEYISRAKILREREITRREELRESKDVARKIPPIPRLPNWIGPF